MAPADHPVRVLLAEDEPVIAMGLEQKLGRLGFVVVGTAGDGVTALEMAVQLAPDVLLLDINMPRLTGLEVAERLAAENRAIPTVVVTAYEDETLVDRAIAAGVGAYLVKPVDERQLSVAIRLATSRFAEFGQLHREVESLKEALEARKLVERAKGLLMAGAGLSEQAAFEQVQKAARDRQIAMAEAARRIIDAEALLRAHATGALSSGRQRGTAR